MDSEASVSRPVLLGSLPTLGLQEEPWLSGYRKGDRGQGHGRSSLPGMKNKEPVGLGTLGRRL